MVRRPAQDVVVLSVPFDDRQTDPVFTENTLEEVWDMVKRVRRKSGPREQSYTVLWPKQDQGVDIIVRRRQSGAAVPAGGEVHQIVAEVVH